MSDTLDSRSADRGVTRTGFALGPGPYADPTGHRVAELLVKYAAPATVLGAAVDSVVARPVVRAGYADDRRSYPIHSPAAAWVSAAAYHDAGSRHDKVAAALAGALRLHGLHGEWARLAALGAATCQKRASADAPVYALSAPDRYPITTENELGRAVDYFMRYRDALSDDDRRAYATAVVKRAADKAFYRGLPDRTVAALETEAGLGRLARDWTSSYELRARLAESAGGCPELATALRKEAQAPPADPARAAALLRRLDLLAGWDLPEPVLVDETPTTAFRKLAAAVESATGNWYRADDLARVVEDVGDDLLRDVIGLDTPSVIKGAGLRTALAGERTAPATEQILADLGVQPAYRIVRRPDWLALASGQ